ncbi:hypothetical protein THAOC_02971 [Thalassiosira oceanica]|uniref:Fe2OG dioxygenase domain-containing protein n=1 Tax=Thalassiosira oceanica TaxID=159749 RepID=K0TLH5_THAOC|nr:hypothetical protein THAOC_02971 [Thalassiosira oceanica]|eukprot:EJK75306.1 hypothetical protein THAOC_02971 [Thalassiosira oceanica]
MKVDSSGGETRKGALLPIDGHAANATTGLLPCWAKATYPSASRATLSRTSSQKRRKRERSRSGVEELLAEIDPCHVCGSSVSLADRGLARRLPHFVVTRNITPSIPCSFCRADDSDDNHPCGTVFCSDECRDAADAALRVGSQSSGLPPPRLFFCKNRFGSSKEWSATRDGLTSIENRFTSAFGREDLTRRVGIEETALLVTLMSSCGSPNRVVDSLLNATQSTDRINVNEEGIVEEIWALTRSFMSICPRHHKSTPAKDCRFPTLSEFVAFYTKTKRFDLLKVDGPQHPLESYVTNTLTSTRLLNEKDRQAALDMLDPSWLSLDKPQESMSETESEVLRWRKVSHLAHWASSTNAYTDGESGRLHALLRRPYYAYHPIVFSQLPHSCIPSLAPVLQLSVEHGMNRPVLQWIALHDVAHGDFSVSRIEVLNGDLESRALELKRTMGGKFACACSRCRFEEHFDSSNLSSKELKHLGDLAMQQTRYEDASLLYDKILETHPRDFDVLHSKAASYLGRASAVSFGRSRHCMGHFVKAQRLWGDAGKLDNSSSHKEIEVQLKKLTAYQMKIDRERDESMVRYSSYLDEKCFVTAGRVLSHGECNRMIQIAEDHAVRLGWTTSRHFAVPTTDMPIHDLPGLQAIFCRAWENKIRPLLRQQFRIPSDSECHIHDAFLVKYGASMQRYLPPHVDESNLSFVVALNDDSFEGGGTYIHTLGKTLKPPVGGMLSFCGGEILHSGDPVVSGIRYIVAGFCYVDLRAGGVDIDSQTRQGKPAKESFAFGFQV